MAEEIKRCKQNWMSACEINHLHQQEGIAAVAPTMVATAQERITLGELDKVVPIGLYKRTAPSVLIGVADRKRKSKEAVAIDLSKR